MKRFLIVLVILICATSLALAAGPEGDQAKDPKGFRDYLWGTSLETLSNKEVIFFSSKIKATDGKNIEVYADVRMKDKGLISLYAFAEKKLVAGTFTIALGSKEKFLGVVKELWGEPTSTKDGDLFWNFRTTRIVARTSLRVFEITLSDRSFMEEI